ncbi:MAG TPA: PDZ domain-containing protein [Polyangiaceae bacterium]|nr:PDZ domain-containing protein [Polyangiaceae bacterium]
MLLCIVTCSGGGLACTSERGTIGAMLVQQPNQRLVVKEVPSGLGAAQAGVQEGDEVLLIDGRDPRSMSPREVHQALSGEVGAPVKLTLIRKDQVIRVRVARTPAPALRARPTRPD